GSTSGMTGPENDSVAPATTPLRTEPTTPPAHPDPGPMGSPASGIANFPLAPAGIRSAGPTTMSGVRGSETMPEPSAPTPLRTEANAPLEVSERSSSLTFDAILHGDLAAEQAERDMRLAMVRSICPPDLLREIDLARSERTEAKNQYRSGP